MKPFNVIFKNAKFTFYSSYTVKIEYSPNSQFIEQDLFVSEINNVKTIKPEVLILKDNIIQINTTNLKIYYKSQPNGFSKNNLKIWYKYDNRYKKWFYGKKDKKNLKGSTLDLMKYPKVRGKYLTEGVLSKDGYYVYEDFSYYFWTKNSEWAIQKAIPDYKILFFIGYGNNYQLGLQEFSNIFGKIPMVPIWVFGYWYSKWFPYHQNEFIKIVDKYRALKIPIDVLVVDTDWRKNGWTGFDWNEKYFPQPAKFISEMKKRGIKIVLNDHPGYNSSEPLLDNDSHFKKICRFLNIEPQTEWRCNWADNKSVKAVCEVLLKPKLKQGIDFWWVDGWGADGLPKIEEFLKKNRWADKMALGIDAYKKLNPQLWLNFFYYKSTIEVHKKRAIILSRWGGIGSHRYPVWFSGDTYSDWRTLAYQVYFTYTAGNILTNYWSHDLGGFLGERIPKELFIRWIQFGAFSPIMRTHSSKGPREPWSFDNETVQIFRKYVRIRYRLLPYFNRLNFESYKFASPLVRAMYYEYPNDKNSYRFKYQYLLGPSILVAPVVARNSIKKIYFPKGDWLDIESGLVIKGPAIRKFKVPLNIIPVFIKKGSIIPVSQEMNFIGEKDTKNLQFEIFGVEQYETSYEYYEDDGLSFDYQKGKYTIIPIKVKKENEDVIIKIGRNIGNYKKMPLKRKICMILHITDNVKIKNVFINEKRVDIKKEPKMLGELKSPFQSYRCEFNYKME